MYFSMTGIITYIFNNAIVINVNDINYSVFISNKDSYKIGEKCTIYLYHVLKEEEESLIGFKTIEDKKIFLLLISVKGIGPKTAINAIKDINKEDLINAIKSENLQYLQSLPGIGSKAAKQIILDLKDKLVKKNTTNLKDVVLVLRNLGFKNKEINSAISDVDLTLSKQEILKIMLKKLKK